MEQTTTSRTAYCNYNNSNNNNYNNYNNYNYITQQLELHNNYRYN